MDGWIKLWRKLSESELWLSEKFTGGQAWVDLLLNANHKPGVFKVRGNIVKVERGQVAMSEVTLSKRWRWSRNKVRRYIRTLIEDEKVEQQTDNLTSIITICNYPSYQGRDTADDTADGTPERQQTIQQTEHKQEDKKNKNDKKKEEEDIRRKRKPAKHFIPPTEQDVVDFFIEKGFSEQAARKAFQYYSINDWSDSRGQKIKNWKQKMIGVWFKDENRAKARVEISEEITAIERIRKSKYQDV